MPAVRLKPISQQVMVITGASSGIGLATAEAAVAAGAKVVMTSRNAGALAAEQARLGPESVEIVVADIADDDAAERVAAAAIARFGRIDTWVNNAAAASVGPIVDTPVSDQQRGFDVGYWGLVRGSIAALARLQDRGGAIINVGSIESDRSVILQATYSAMKHAVRGFTEGFRMEVEAAGHPVSVTLIKPAAMHTPFPEHARNFTDHPITLPPVMYDPRLAARAILFAATTPKRDVSIGGTHVLATMLAQHFPRITDRMLEMFGERVQTFDTPPPADRADNHWEPRTDAIDSTQKVPVRHTSLWLEAQMHPMLATAIAGAAGLAALAMLGGSAVSRRR